MNEIIEQNIVTIIAIEIYSMPGEITSMRGEIKSIKDLKITTNKQGFSFIINYNKGKKLKIGDKLNITTSYWNE